MQSQANLALVGKHLTLRDWQVDDLASFAPWQQPGHQWHELDGPYYARPQPHEIEQIVAQRREKIEASDWPNPRISLVIAYEQHLIGMVSRYWQSEETHWLSVGIVIYDPTYWGRGFGHEALGLWGEYLFNAMSELARLDLRTWSGNQGMMRLALKLGYREEARFRNARIVKGEFYDGMGYGILREEWAQLYPHGFTAHLQAEG